VEKELIFRFVVGGLAVAGFSSLGDTLKPKTFAGLFGAAPSVALATLTLTIFASGKDFATSEARSMIGGAIAFFVYACLVSRIMFRYKPPTIVAASTLLLFWFGTAFGLWFVWLR
jgi:hypothetical protein